MLSTYILDEPCITTNDSPDKNAPCALPFKFNGELKNACITDTDPDGRYWCSTKVNPRTREHIGGQGKWGFCQNSCKAPAQLLQFFEDLGLYFINKAKK